MTSDLTPKEKELVVAVLSELGDVPAVDFEKVASKCGYKYGKNARAVFKKAWDKLRSSASSSGTAIDADDNTGDRDQAVETVDKTKTKSKATPRKTERKVTTPRKASVGGPKAPRNRKKSTAKVEDTPSPVDSLEQGSGSGVTAEQKNDQDVKDSPSDDTDLTVDAEA